MSYAAPTYSRFAYGYDGTVVLSAPSSLASSTDVTSTFAPAVNDEDSDAYLLGSSYTQSVYSYYIFLFPESRNLNGYYINGYGVNVTPVYILDYSTDTTNGLDGTWTNVGTMNYDSSGSGMQISCRTAIQSITQVTCKAIRIKVYQSTNLNGNSVYLRNLHLFGSYTKQGLALWHPTLDQELQPSDLNFNEEYVNTTASLQFRVKNNHATQTASTITVSANDVSGTLTPQVSTDGTTYASTATIASLAPGIISSPLYVQIGTGTAAGLMQTRITASAASWA